MVIRDQGIHEGLYDIGLEFNMAVGSVGPDQDSQLPGAIFGVSRIGIIQVPKAGPNTVDAAKVNPAKKRKAKA